MPEDPRQRFLIVRLGALGDLVHTLPAFAALRASFPNARIDWVVERKWSPLLELTTGIDEIIPLDRTFTGVVSCIQRLRRGHYDLALDFQGLYKSASLALLSGARRTIGFGAKTARESGAALFYTDRVTPSGPHVTDRNISIAERAGAKHGEGFCFPLGVPEAEMCRVRELLAAKSVGEYFVVSPGGGWKSKCWPPERYALLSSELWKRYRLAAVINVAPKEADLADALTRAAAPAQPVVVQTSIKELAAILKGARFVVGADSGPVHLAAALGTPVVALFGPTDPARNGPLPAGIVLRNASADVTTYKRGDVYSSAMLSLSVEQVLEAAERQLGVAA